MSYMYYDHHHNTYDCIFLQMIKWVVFNFSLQFELEKIVYHCGSSSLSVTILNSINILGEMMRNLQDNLICNEFIVLWVRQRQLCNQIPDNEVWFILTQSYGSTRQSKKRVRFTLCGEIGVAFQSCSLWRGNGTPERVNGMWKCFLKTWGV